MSGPTLPDPGGFEREWKRRFERFASAAGSEHEVSGWSEAGLRRRVAVFERLLADIVPDRPVNALDLGCGAGTYVRLMGARGHRALGIDYSLPSLRRARNADAQDPCRYVGGDAYSLPLPDQAFDLVVMIGIFQAISDPVRALREAGRVLRPGGHLILEILNSDDFVHRTRRLFDLARSGPGGVRSYHRSEMLKWLRSVGFRALAQAPIFLPPRRLPQLERLLDHRLLQWALHRVPGCATGVAAAFLILSQRGAAAFDSATASDG